MIESFVFHLLKIDFEEKALRVNDSVGSHKTRPYHNETWCSSSGKVEPQGENVFLLWNIDLTIGATAIKRRPATFGQSSFSRTPNLFLLCSALHTS